ncbi:MAG: efflux RND transporter periplasmic adaptor subunit [Candidatus Omnitrophota bacterium]
MTVIQKDTPIVHEWVASTDGFVNATIRPQVTGYLMSQLYKEGEFVKKEQILFEIDPRTFEANVAQAEGDFVRAEANWNTAKLNLERIQPLAEQNAVSQKDLDDAVGNESSARASTSSSGAALQKAKLDLSFTKILAPIDGIAGNATAQVGDLVGPSQTEILTTVSTLDPLKVYIPISEKEYLQSVSVNIPWEDVVLRLILTDGSVYAEEGRLFSTDRQINAKTGTILVTALFPNPKYILRPGQFAKVQATIRIQKGALLVPQRAVTEMQGVFQVAIVGKDNKIEIRTIKPGERVDSLWIIDDGLNPGDVIVIEGTQKVRPGMTVKTKPFETTVTPMKASTENP